MADRTSAGIFATIFEMLAKSPTDEHKAMAKKLWPMRREYDFNDCQMECDKALAKLGLARKGVDPRYPEDGKVWLYGPKGEES